MNNFSKYYSLNGIHCENNMKYMPSVTNFLTLRFASSDKAEKFCNSLLKKGVIVRNLSSFGLVDCVRVTIGVSDENNFLINCIRKLEM